MCEKFIANSSPAALIKWTRERGAARSSADEAADDDVLTAEQRIDNTTNGSVEPFEKALVAEGIVSTELDKISITRAMCKEIVERTPGGSSIARAAAVGNLPQELQLIKKSMKDAADKDVNGDGRVNAEGKRIAASASYAAPTLLNRPRGGRPRRAAPLIGA